MICSISAERAIGPHLIVGLTNLHLIALARGITHL